MYIHINYISTYITHIIHNAGELPPTLQSTVIPAWNYAPQLPGKVTQLLRSLQTQHENVQKKYNPKLTKHHENVSQWFQTREKYYQKKYN